MAVAISAQWHFGVVKVKHVNAVEPNLRLRLLQEFIDAALGVNFITSSPRVRGIQTYTQMRMVEGFHESSELFQRSAAK